MKFTFFWGGPFSQWHRSPFTLDNQTFVTAEQYMMYKKALLFDDTSIARLIMETSDPRMQKKLGRAVSNYDDSVWSNIADEIVYYGNRAKFTQNAVLHAALIATEGTVLVEASPYDCRWGIGLSADDPRAQDQSQWRGENRLGFILTRLRDDLKGEYNEEVDRS